MDGDAGDKYIKHAGNRRMTQNLIDGDELMEILEMNISNMLELEGDALKQCCKLPPMQKLCDNIKKVTRIY